VWRQGFMVGSQFGQTHDGDASVVSSQYTVYLHHDCLVDTYQRQAAAYSDCIHPPFTDDVARYHSFWFSPRSSCSTSLGFAGVRSFSSRHGGGARHAAYRTTLHSYQLARLAGGYQFHPVANIGNTPLFADDVTGACFGPVEIGVLF
jgi:hypothetical protein